MKAILFAALALVSMGVLATTDVHVHGYTKQDGTYVQPHERSAPDDSKSNNYSTKGNVNPHTGQTGTKDED